MEQHKIDRINALAKKAREEGLTLEETAERDLLRAEYVAAVRQSLQAHLDHTYVVDETGNKRKLRPKQGQ